MSLRPPFHLTSSPPSHWNCSNFVKDNTRTTAIWHPLGLGFFFTSIPFLHLLEFIMQFINKQFSLNCHVYESLCICSIWMWFVLRCMTAQCDEFPHQNNILQWKISSPTDVYDTSDIKSLTVSIKMTTTTTATIEWAQVIWLWLKVSVHLAVLKWKQNYDEVFWKMRCVNAHLV